MLAHCKHAECTVPKHYSGIAAFYIKKYNIYTSLHKYIYILKKHKPIIGKKKKTLGTVAIVPVN